MKSPGLLPARCLLPLILLCSILISTARAFDWVQSDGPEGGWIWDLEMAPDGDLWAATWGWAPVFRSPDWGTTWIEAGLEGRYVSEIAITNDGWVLAGFPDGDVHRTQDDGANWSVSGIDLVDHGGALAYDPVQDVVYAASSDRFSRSTDDGQTWQEINSDPPLTQVECLVAVPDGGPLLVGTEGSKVYRSLDLGVTWDPFDAGMDATIVYDLIVDPAEGRVYAATFGGGGVYWADWDGASWTAISQGLDDPLCNTISLDSGGRLWVGTQELGVFMSDDGASWSMVSTGIEEQAIHSLLAPGGDEVFAGSAGGGVHHTVNAGGLWEPANSGIVASDVSALVLEADGTMLASTHGAGALRSTDNGATWLAINSGLEDYNLFDIVAHPDGDLFVGTWESNLYRSQDDGASWTHADDGLSVVRVSCLAVKSTGDLFAGGLFAGGVWRSTDKGDTWTPASTGLSDDQINDLFVENDGDLLAATYAGGVCRSENDGDTWSPINDGLTDLSVNQVLTTSVGTLFAGTEDGGLCRSLNDGVSWERVDASLPDNTIRALAVNAQGHVFASGYYADIYRSTDGGDTWSLVSDGLPFIIVRCLGFDQSDRLHAGTDGLGNFHTVQTTPVLLSTWSAHRVAAGAITIRWTSRGAGVGWAFDVFRDAPDGPRVQLTSEPLTRGPTFEFTDTAAPAQATSYRLRLTRPAEGETWFGPLEVGTAYASDPASYLGAVRPNPIVDMARVRFVVPRSGGIDLGVFDARGRLVRRLASGVSEAGPHEVTWDVLNEHGHRVGAGTYFIRMDTGAATETRRVLVLP